MKIQITLLTLAAIPHLGLAAEVTGTWKSEFDSQIGAQKYTYTLKQDGTNLTGKANSEVSGQKRARRAARTVRSATTCRMPQADAAPERGNILCATHSPANSACFNYLW